jgi:tetratricopeptide (TPR) repeat protein
MPPFDADHYLAVAASYFDTGAFARCVEACRRGVAEHPADARLWDRLGIAAWALDDWPAVAEALEAAGRLTPRRPLARLALADAYLGLGRRADAVRELVALTEPRACDTEMLANAAGRLFRAGEYRRAERAWRRVLRRRPRWAEAHYQLAACLWALEADPEVLFLPLHEAVMLAPDEPKYALALANVWLEAGSPCDAAEVLATVDPDKVDCSCCRVRAVAVLRDVGDLVTAALWEAGSPAATGVPSHPIPGVL